MSEFGSKDARHAVQQVKHPEISRTLDQLGMIRDAQVQDNVVRITLALPLPTVPIQDYLVQLLTDAVREVDKGADARVEIVQMTSEEKDHFFNMAREGWEGL